LVANQQWGLASPVSLEALGGVLEVAFEVEPKGFSHIVLTGPVARVFEGEWTA
jgi:diaminopimelate epimerase